MRWGWLGAACGCVAAGAAMAGPPFRTDDPVPVDPGHFEINLFSIATAASGAWSGTLPSFEVNYGALPGVQLHIIVPEQFATGPNGKTALGAGDVELGAKIRLFAPADSDWYPQIGLYPTLEVPTADPARGLGTGHPQAYLPVWLQKDWGNWSLYGGGGIWINPGAGNRNYSYAGVALWRKLTERLTLGVEVFNQTRQSTTLPQGAGFNVGSIYDFSEHWHLLMSAGTGVTSRERSDQVSYYVGVQLTF